jgi:hypothetical protein
MNRNTAVNFIKSIINNKYTTIEQSVSASSSKARLRMGTIYGEVLIPNNQSVNKINNKLQEIINEK